MYGMGTCLGKGDRYIKLGRDRCVRCGRRCIHGRPCISPGPSQLSMQYLSGMSLSDRKLDLRAASQDVCKFAAPCTTFVKLKDHDGPDRMLWSKEVMHVRTSGHVFAHHSDDQWILPCCALTFPLTASLRGCLVNARYSYATVCGAACAYHVLDERPCKFRSLLSWGKKGQRCRPWQPLLQRHGHQR